MTSILLPLSYFGRFWQEKSNLTFLRWNLFFIFSQLGLLIIKFNDLPSTIPFYYSLPWGEAQLAPTSSLFLLPAFSIIIFIFNHLLAVFLYRQEILFSRILTVFSSIFSLLALFSLVNIIFLIS